MESESRHELFRRFLERLAEEGLAPLDALCDAHPEHREELKANYSSFFESWSEDDPVAPVSAPGDESDLPPGVDFTTTLLKRIQSRSVNERYRRVGELAHGSQGHVYRAWDGDLHRHLAMKVSVHCFGKSPAGLEGLEVRRLARLVEEAQVTGQLDHPGVVPIHDVGVDDDGHFYFTMRLVRGQTLGEVFRKVESGEDGWTLTRALGTILKVCETMAFAHSRDVVHRDLKPSNIMVGRFGELYVMDWGLARFMYGERTRDEGGSDGNGGVDAFDSYREGSSPGSPDLTLEGEVLGTPSFMSPEQASGKREEVGPATDIYAVGAILYLLLTGRRPYQSDGDSSPVAMWQRVMSGPPEPIESLSPRAPVEVVAIAERAMARDVEDRYPDMETMAEDLRAFLEGRVVTAYRTGPWVEFRKWVLRNRAFAGAAAALLVVAVVGSWAYAWNEARLSDEILRYATRARADQLASEIEGLGPVGPGAIPEIERCIAEGEKLLAELPSYERRLEALRLRALPVSDEVLAASSRTHPRYPEYLQLSGYVSEVEQTIGGLPQGPDREALERYLPLHRERFEELRPQVEELRPYSFAAASDAGVHDQLASAVESLERIERVELPKLETWRLAAGSLEERSLRGHADRWSEACADIAVHPAYGFGMEPQLGLVPIGVDPDSGLWEFWHVLSGTEPLRGDDERLRLEEESGIVLVLLPGLFGQVGAQRQRPNEPNYDPSALGPEGLVAFDLEPFFLSKYEMTQAQWLRLTGEIPSYFFAGSHWKGFGSVSGLHPVENITWQEARATVERFGLELPTEAQWELAARAGADTPFHFGAQFSPAYGVNLAGTGDGYPFHAPVGSERANGYGLFDVHGNVREFCRDLWADRLDQFPRDSATGEVASVGFQRRAVRGGTFAASVREARSAYRMNMERDQRGENTGLRPARPLLRSSSAP